MVLLLAPRPRRAAEEAPHPSSLQGLAEGPHSGCSTEAGDPEAYVNRWGAQQ